MPIQRQSREIIYNVLEFTKKERDAGELLVSKKRVHERVAEMTGVSERSVKKIVKESMKISEGQSTSFSAPSKKRIKQKRVVDLDDFDKGILKGIILNMYSEDKIVPTLRVILSKFKETTGFDGCKESLRTVIRNVGFRYRKTGNCKKLLIERHDIRSQRINYLRSIKNYRNEGRPIIYMDETYINSSHTNPSECNGDSKSELKRPVTKGLGLTIVHGGSESGIIPNAQLIIKSGSKSGDYHADMNFQNYKKWIEETLIPNLPAQSVIVIGNMPYHTVQLEKVPTSTSTKASIIEWLRWHDIAFDDSYLKPQLYDLVLSNKTAHKKFAISEILLSHNHNILRLPPHHPDLNPFQLVWKSLKQYVGARNTTCRLDDLKKLCEEFFTNFSLKDWKDHCDVIIKSENDYRTREEHMDEAIDSFIINFNDDEDDDSDTTSDEESEDDDE